MQRTNKLHIGKRERRSIETVRSEREMTALSSHSLMIPKQVLLTGSSQPSSPHPSYILIRMIWALYLQGSTHDVIGAYLVILLVACVAIHFSSGSFEL